MPQTDPHAQLVSADTRPLLVELLGAGEWIVSLPACGRSLHVYRLDPADWLVSEVGRDSEGRGATLEQALARLSAAVSSPGGWWDLVAGALDAGQSARGDR